VLPIYAAVLLSHAVLNHVGVRAVSRLNWLSAWYHIVGIAVLVTLLVLLAPKQDASFLLRRFGAEGSGHGYAYVFLLGLLQAQWTFTGYDASAHITEETVDPRRNAPWGIFLSVAVSAVVGWLMLLAVTLAIPDLRETAAAPNPFIYILREALGSRLGGALVWMVIGAMWFCGLSSITSNSRMLYAFARDGGLPGARALARVSPRFQSPHVAVWVSSAGALAVAVWADAYSAMVALSTIALYASYGLPIAACLLASTRGSITKGPWTLGRYSRPVAVAAVLWIAFITVLFVLPPNQLAGWTFGGFLVLLAVYWFGWMRTRFEGPKLGRP
jgi:amino acid transporter